MSDQPKKATELTTEELAKRLFPPEVVEELKKVANPPQKPEPPASK